MIIFSNLTKVFCLGNYCSRYSYMLLLIIPVLIITYFLIRKNFVKFMSKYEQEQYEKERKRLRIIMLITRGIIFTLLIIAISSPFLLESRMVKGNPRLTILTDNSNSFELFDTNIGKELNDKLKSRIPVELRSIGLDEKSAIGNGILNNLEGGENILVISDGNNNEGKLLGDVILFASSINSTINTLRLKPKNNDISVKIEGAYEVIMDTEATYQIIVNNVGEDLNYLLEVTIDEQTVFSKRLKGSQTIPITKKFSGEEFHKMTAKISEIQGKDYFKQNNVYYKTIKVVQRPSVLFITKKSSPLKPELERLYDITTTSSIPNDFTNYMALILNDIPASDILPKFDKLQDYVSEQGNGLVFIGGESSYDRGNYRGTLIETLLPIKIGAGEESEKSDVQVVVVLDISGTTTQVYENGQLIQRDFDKVIKALAVSVLDSLDKKTNVGVVAVGTSKSPFVGVVSEIKTLSSNKDDLIDKIARLKGGGQTAIEEGIKQATNMLSKTGGGKNIILISDGKGLMESLMLQTKNTVRNSAVRGIKTYVVGVGAKEKQETQFLSDIALIGNGFYWPADASNKLKILFGKPDQAEKDYYNKLSVIDTVHFITSGIELDAVISGYNYAVPKAPARLLVSTNKNIPIETVWRYGLGRVVAIATDDGSKWAGELLSKKDSQLITRSINWAIGNLGRVKDFDVTIKDTTLGKDTYIIAISKEIPKHDDLFFAKTDSNTYSARFKPKKEGFYNFLGADVAVNYNIEYLNLGINKDFLTLVNTTGGGIFDKDDIDTIADFVIEKSRRVKTESTSFVWPFALLALIIFLIDIFIRRLWENNLIR